MQQPLAATQPEPRNGLARTTARWWATVVGAMAYGEGLGKPGGAFLGSNAIEIRWVRPPGTRARLGSETSSTA